MSRNINDIALGKSKATKLNNHEVIDLFFNYEKLHHNVESRNFNIVDNVLFHNGSIEMVRRKKDGLIIKNSQEIQRSGGMMNHVTCPSLWQCKDKHISLPIEQINRELGDSTAQISVVNNVELIEIIDDGDNSDNELYIDNTGVIIKLRDKYYWYRRDERHFYLIQLPRKVTSIKDANDSLMPNLVTKSKDVKRQGDFYFIPVNQDIKEYDKFGYVKSFNLNYYNQDRFTKEIEILGDLFLWKFPESFEKSRLSAGEDSKISWSEVISDLRDRFDWYHNENPLTYHKKEQLDYMMKKINELIPYTDKVLTRYDIYDSNHIADNSYFDGVNQFVKGFIYHKNKDHQRIKLEDWHLVLKNEALSGVNVDANGRGGFD